MRFLLHVERHFSEGMRKYRVNYRLAREIPYTMERRNWTEIPYLREISESPGRLWPK